MSSGMNKHALLLLVLACGAAPARAQDALTEGAIVQRALAHNPSLRAAMLDLQSAQLAVESESLRYEPRFILDAGVTRSESPFLTQTGTLVSGGTTAEAGIAARKTFAWGTDLTLRLGGDFQRRDAGTTGAGILMTPALGPGYGLNARLTLAQPLLRGAGRQLGEAELRAARVRRTTAEHARDRAASELLRSVLSAYWDLWLARTTLAIEERSRGVALAQRDDARARANTGSLAPAAVLTFETAVATREEAVLSARTDVERKRAALRQRVGEPGAALSDPSEPVPSEQPIAPSDALHRALADSPLVLERASTVLLAETQSRTADDPLRPRLDLEAYLQAEGLGNEELGPAAEGLVSGQAISAHLGLVYEAPFSSDRRRAEAARARIAVDSARAALDEAKASVTAELEVALAEQSAGGARLQLAEQTVEIAKQQLAAEQARLAAGASTPLSVVQAEDDLRSAELRVAQARAGIVQSGLTLAHLTGALLARHGAAQ
jgi:outer membrane protein TolC